MAIEKYNKPQLIFPKCEITKTGLLFNETIEFNEWKEIGRLLKNIEGSVQFWIGDWINYGSKKWEHEKYDNALVELGYKKKTLENISYVSNQIETSRRREVLDYSHHAEVASLTEEKQNEWLDKAEKENLTLKNLRQQIRHSKKPEILNIPKDKYDVFLVDPPWEYRNTGVQGAVDKQYPTMSINELCKLPINEISYKNSVLFLWTTNPILEESFEVIKSWGFSYKTNLVWIKINKKTGIGFYVRGLHELLLICIKGQKLPNFIPTSIIEKEVKRHSQKPELYELIEKMYPNSKYIEFFARENIKRKNWEYWGNEANK